MAVNLAEITGLLSSDKIKERQEGLQTLKNIFSQDKKLDQVDAKGWVVIFTAFFQAFAKDKQAVTKKGYDAKATTGTAGIAARRLGEFAQTLRWLVERIVKRLNRKAVTVLLDHLYLNVKYYGHLFEPVAIDYLRTIQTILQWKPHLDHLDPENWLKLAELSFNVILEDGLKTRLEDPVEGGVRKLSPTAGPSDNAMESGDETEEPASPMKKRRRADSPRARSRTPNPAALGEDETKSVTKEKVTVASILSLLLASPSSPLVSVVFPFLPEAVLNRFHRFLCIYKKGSLHQELLSALSVVLPLCSLNKSKDVARFARDSWPNLVKLWGAKELKDQLMVIVRQLLPFLAVGDSSPAADAIYADELTQLWQCLEKEALQTTRFEALSLDSLRLKVLADGENPDAFVARTFRYGWKFDARQASAWAVLELRADCAAKLYAVSESVQSMDHGGRKRAKLEDPITSLLSAIQTDLNVSIRAYHLQCLLFLVDRHWAVFHTSLRDSIINTLMQFLSYDDSNIQSWVFVCLAAVVHACGTLGGPFPSHIPSSSNDSGPWDAIWTHAMRRSNVTRVCRAACHVAYTLLCHAKLLLSSSKVLVEIETLGKDLTIQGPSFPYDSVCAFLILCIRVASQDVRLYRLQLEEKVLTWLTDSWRPTKTWDKLKMPSHTAGDVVSLLEAVCGAGKQVDLVCEMLLPDSVIVDAVLEDHSTAVIREYVLHARLPPFCPTAPLDNTRVQGGDSSSLLPSTNEGLDLLSPGGKERRLSAFFAKQLEEFLQDAEASNGSTVEKIRVALDFAVVALSFETMLCANGTRPTRRTLQAACKLFCTYMSVVLSSHWTWNERTFLIAALDPLLLAEPSERDFSSWEMMLSPGDNTGVRRDVLRSLRNGTDTNVRRSIASRREFQRLLFRSSDAQDALTEVLTVMRKCLRLVGDSIEVQRATPEFGEGPARRNYAEEIRVSNEAKDLARDLQGPHASAILSRVIHTCMSTLATIPVLQSSSGEPTRDLELFELIKDLEGEAFFSLAGAYFSFVRQHMLHLNASNLTSLLEKIGSLAREHFYSRSETLRLLAISALRSTMHVWASPSSSDDTLSSMVGALSTWLISTLDKRHMLSWRIADSTVQFLDDYLRADPSEQYWARDEDNKLPHTALHDLVADVDIRVRLRAVIASARSFGIIKNLQTTPKDWYNLVRERLSTNTDFFEEILTRLICLGNILLVSSSVRRGAYWHLLEVCLFSSSFNRHLGAVLEAVTERMGLTISSLFQAYATQVAYSIRQADKDFLSIPPHLLGCRDLKDCAQATFQTFTPTNLLTGGPNPKAEKHGRSLFKNHCQVLKKEVQQGLRECFAEVVGQQIAFWMHENGGAECGRGSLGAYLKGLVAELGTSAQFPEHLRPFAAGIVTAIVRAIGDQDYTSSGPIVASLRAMSDTNADTFVTLTKYRNEDFTVHEAILPAYDSASIIQSLDWFNTIVPFADDSAITYHVLHRLFADLERTPLVNEQLRLLNVICLWVATRHDHYRHPALLKTLLTGAVNVLSQHDLARGAQSVLDWAMLQLKYVRNDDSETRVTEILLRTSCIAHDYSTQADLGVAQMGEEMLQWIEGHALRLCHTRAWRPQVLKALAAWPRDLNSALQDIGEQATAHELSNFLQDDRLSTNKFRVVRRLQKLATTGLSDEDQFAKSDFWRLKDCIPAEDRLVVDDVQAFADLLLLNKGRIDGLDNVRVPVQSARTLHVLESKRSGVEQGIIAPRRAIIASLLVLLDDPSASQVYLSFKTLRSLAASTSTDPLGSSAWPTRNNEELNYLKAYSTPPSPRSGRNLEDLLSSEAAMECTKYPSKWMTFMASSLCISLSSREPFYGPLSAMLEDDPRFAEELLPILAHTILRSERGVTPGPSTCCNMLSQYFSAILGSESASISCRRAIVDTILHLRQFTPPNTTDPLGHDKWLAVDFILLSRNAILCGAYTTALLFTELAAEYSNEATYDRSAVEQVLYDIYSHIDEPDGFYGIQTQDLTGFLLKRFRHENQWQKAFQFHGAASETQSPAGADVGGVLRSLHAFGFNQLAMTTMRNATALDDSFDPGTMSYDVGWRTETWDLPERTSDSKGLSLYLALRAAHRERDSEAVRATVQRALIEETSRLRNLGDENISEIREVSRNLLCLNEIRHWQARELQDSLREKVIKPSFQASLGDIDQSIEFSFLEALTATRISLLRSVRSKEEREQIGTLRFPFTQSLVDAETKCLVHLSEASRKAGDIQIALNSIVQAQRLGGTPRFDVSQEFARVLWSSQEPRPAVQFLHNLVDPATSRPNDVRPPDIMTKASLYALLGTWSSEAFLDKPENIKREYFDVAVSLAAPGHTEPTTPDLVTKRAFIFHRYAIFAERQYLARARSQEALRLKVLVERKQREIEKRQQDGRKQDYEIMKANKLLEADKQRKDEYQKSLDAFLEQAIKMYACSLSMSDEFDDSSTIRLCSLWFANFDHSSDQFQSNVDAALNTVPSRKFVFLAHQLSARLSRPDTGSLSHSQRALRSVITRMCRDHPYHSLFPLYCLRSDRNTSRRQSSRHETPASQVQRADAASDIFQQLIADSAYKDRVLAVQRVCDASLEWARHPIMKKGASIPKVQDIPRHLKIMHLKNVQVPIITIHTPVDVTHRYENCVWIQGYKDKFETAGGINLPKISICIGSDGKGYKQLFKGEGNDDLRQDAVMEQVFDLVNMVLRHDRETTRRNLHVRGYKVIPLAAQAGVIEFVTDTAPLVTWLKKAHVQYNPQDIEAAYFYNTMHAKRGNEGAGDAQLQAELTTLFCDLRKRFHPVMRHFFTEQHKLPLSWFRMRLNYTRSVAVTSIVGHVLGLGDRHLSNILLDYETGEVVHIDLGIAFEQGTLLKVPERVPFRLTADMVDGLGTSGVNGVFRRCAEETLRVLRDGSEVILTVLEVFKHDPLHSWTASELKVKQAQSDETGGELTAAAFKFAVGFDTTAGTVEESADRALSGVTRKLDKGLSVEFTVNELISEATDPQNLANMFIGWCPHY